MELSKEFHDLVSRLVSQKRDELWQEQSKLRDKIRKDSAGKGFDIPQPFVYGKFDDLQVNSIQSAGDIVWGALEKTLEAFNPSFCPELATQLYSLAENFFPLSICEPHDYLRGGGWKRPMEDQASQQLRSLLENARRSSLNSIKTNIGLYVEKIKNRKQDFTGSIHIGDNYSAGQVGAMGPNAKSSNMTFQQVWNQGNASLDFQKLMEELAVLREALQREATTPEHAIAIGAVAAAEVAAKEGNSQEVLGNLKKVGNWAVDVVNKIGVNVVSEVLKSALGMP